MYINMILVIIQAPILGLRVEGLALRVQGLGLRA